MKFCHFLSLTICTSLQTHPPGDRVLRPFSLHPALGQALLHCVAAWTAPSAPGALPGGPPGALGSGPSGSGPSALLSSLGLTLPGAVAAGRGAGGGRLDLRRDRYEEHWALPGAVVLLLTDRRAMALQAPGEDGGCERGARRASVGEGGVGWFERQDAVRGMRRCGLGWVGCEGHSVG